MDDIKQQLADVMLARQEAAAKAQAAGEEEARLRQELAERVKAGESTGDRFMDYAYAQWGGDDRVAGCLRRLEAELSGKTGQHVLVTLIEREWHTTGNGGGFGPHGYEELKRCDVWLGILSDDRLNLDLADGKISLPTGGQCAEMDTLRHITTAPRDIQLAKDDLLTLPEFTRGAGWNGRFAIRFGAEAVYESFEFWSAGVEIGLEHLLALALCLQEPDQLPDKLQAWHQLKVKEFEIRLEKAMDAVLANRAILNDINKRHHPDDLAKAIDRLRAAHRDLRDLQARMAVLHLDPAPIAEFLAKYGT